MTQVDFIKGAKSVFGDWGVGMYRFEHNSGEAFETIIRSAAQMSVIIKARWDECDELVMVEYIDE